MNTPTPAPTAAADQALATLAQTSAEHLAGLLANGMLHIAGRPAKLPHMLFPHIPAEQVWEVWSLALALGVHAGKNMGRPKWARPELEAAQEALAAAGYEQMAALADRSAMTMRAGEHPADVEADRVRGEHW
ncbi:hypothetical protein ACIPW9_35940 [Streptomyces sp. NPDC090052]|uniref:hypothetical protein n=1 Tax=Streptomyces sp. NPDC090052 TaxID=3365931 RepID=UPI003804719D